MRLTRPFPGRLRIQQAFLAVVLLAFSLPVTCQAAAKNGATTGSTAVSTQLIGSWRLVSRESRRANGELQADPGLSSVPLGILIYDGSGHVAAQLSRRDRIVAMIGEECETAATTKGTPDTAQTILGYDAYFGTYRIDEHAGMVTHHLEAALFPGDIGKDIQRHFIIKGDRLAISFSTTTSEGVKVTRTLIWERMK